MTGFARVDSIPGTVAEVVASLSVDDSENWYPFAGGVEAGWNFDGHRFTPPAFNDPDLPVYELTVADEAQIALDASDVTILRCLERGVSVPSSWVTYRTSLRDVVAGRATAMPTRPAYPPNT